MRMSEKCRNNNNNSNNPLTSRCTDGGKNCPAPQKVRYMGFDGTILLLLFLLLLLDLNGDDQINSTALLYFVISSPKPKSQPASSLPSPRAYPSEIKPAAHSMY